MMQLDIAVRAVEAEGHERLALPGRRLLVLCVLAGAVLLVLIAGLQLTLARQSLLGAAKDLRSARLSVNLAALAAHPGKMAKLRDRVAAAEASFDAAGRDLGPWEGVLEHLGWIPRVGPELAAAGPAAGTGYHATRAAVAMMDGLRPIATSLNHPAHGDRLGLLAAGLARSQPQFASAAGDADAAVEAAGGLPRSLHNAHLDALLARLRHEMPVLQNGAHLLASSAALLGVGRPAHYLFAWENPAELRATGGFIGAVDYMTVRSGRISHEFYGHILPHEITTAELPLPQAAYTPEDYWLLCDSNWSPDFPLTARLERWFYGEDTGQWADGVIDFVDEGISSILRATGPVYLPGYRRWVTAGNAQTLAQQYINGRYKGPQTAGLPETVRKQFFHAVLVALLQKFQRLPISDLPRLAGTLETLVSRHDLLLYHRNLSLQNLIRRSGAAGSLGPVAGDSLMVVDDNRSYNKINPYVAEHGTYSATVGAGGEIEASLTLHYAVRPSPANLEGYGPDWGRWGTKHDYQDFLRVYVPAGARLLSLSGGDIWAPQQAYGLTQFAARLLIHAGQERTVSIRYTVPASALGSLRRSLYRLTVQRQPGSNLNALSVNVRSPGWRKPLQTEFRLNADTHIQRVLDGINPAPAQLPPAVVRDPYIGYASLKDPRHPL